MHAILYCLRQHRKILATRCVYCRWELFSKMAICFWFPVALSMSIFWNAVLSRSSSELELHPYLCPGSGKQVHLGVLIVSTSLSMVMLLRNSFTQPHMWWRQGNDYICQFINGETFFPKILDSCTFNLDPRYFDHVDSLNQVKVFHHSLSHKFSFRSIIKDINELNLNQPKSTFSNSLSFPGPLHFPLLAEVFTVCLTSQPWFSTSVVGILLEFKVVELVHANLIKTKFYSCQTTLLQLLFYSVIPSFCKVG